MISALDTNVLLDVLIPNPASFERSLAAIESAGAAQVASQRECDNFVAENGIRAERICQEALFAAVQAWRHYRRQGGRHDRILPDFLVGAHALVQATRLVSRDGGFCRSYFRGLTVADPARDRR